MPVSAATWTIVSYLPLGFAMAVPPTVAIGSLLNVSRTTEQALPA